MINSKSVQEGKRAKSRRTIMHAAKTVIEEKGLENVTFNDVAEEAGMCRTTVFNHFANTEELMVALFQQEISDIEEYCREKGNTGVVAIADIFDKLIEDTAYYPGLSFRLMNSAIINGRNSDSVMRIENMIMSNLPEDDNREQLTMLVMGAYYGLINHRHSMSKEFEANTMKKEFGSLLKIILGGKENE